MYDVVSAERCGPLIILKDESDRRDAMRHAAILAISDGDDTSTSTRLSPPRRSQRHSQQQSRSDSGTVCVISRELERKRARGGVLTATKRMFKATLGGCWNCGHSHSPNATAAFVTHLVKLMRAAKISGA